MKQQVKFLARSFKLIAAGLICINGYGKTIQVGPGKVYTTPGALNTANLSVSSVIEDGDIIEIESGEYKGGEARLWLSENNLTIRGVGADRPLLNNEWIAMGAKGIFTISGNNVTVENIYFAGSKNYDANGAGIRHEGGDLVVRNCKFYYNQMGLQCTSDPSANVLVEYCEFDNNGHVGSGKSHHIYVNNLDNGSFTLQYSYLHNVHNGNSVKSKCGKNYILYNRITNEDAKGSSLIDLPRGGLLVCMGNILQKNGTPDGLNRRIIAYASEPVPPPGSAWSAHHPIKEVHIVNNTVVSYFYFTKFFSAIENVVDGGQVINNAFIGDDMMIMEGSISNVDNKNNYTADFATGAGFVDPVNYDYRLINESSLIDAGTTAVAYGSMSLNPEFQYFHMHKKEDRPSSGTIDIGAYEYSDAPIGSTGIEEKEIAEVLIYPNPAQSEISISLSFAPKKVRVIDVQGHFVMELKNRNYQKVNVEGLSKGFYFIEIESNDGVFVRRFIKQ